MTVVSVFAKGVVADETRTYELVGQSVWTEEGESEPLSYHIQLTDYETMYDCLECGQKHSKRDAYEPLYGGKGAGQKHAYGKGGSSCGCGGGIMGAGLLGPSDGSEPLSVWLWAGPTYSSGTIGSLFGFAEGVNVGYRLTDSIGVYGALGLNHQASSTQILGTIGVQKFGNPNGSGLLDRSSLWVLWDQFSDLEVDDPFLFGVYLHQLRFMAGYVTGYHNEIGVSYSVATSDDTFGAGALSPLGGPGYLTGAGSFIGPYVKQRVGETELTAMIGYSDGASGMAVGIGAERPVTDRLNTYIDFKAGNGGNYAGSIGAAIPLGRADTKHY
jgi:hypothetical protein